MPKCEMCDHWVPRTGSVGWCPKHQCARNINDSCMMDEIRNEDKWGED
jgi:hypothetical protein